MSSARKPLTQSVVFNQQHIPSFCVMAYYDTYQDQLASLYHGHALWVPDPAGLYDHVRVGDVGYVRQGYFLRLFNALLSANDPTQVYGVPEGFVPLNLGPFTNIRTLNLFSGDYFSNRCMAPRRSISRPGNSYCSRK
ncbi:hypothetical protein EDB89DRAFT_1028605 [Lactarius sanguifluus]|nr:hypothetical protein EDB89DRAFT_1028605 [Lactarius sanguifluus]